MEPRLDLTKHSTEALHTLYAMEKYLSKCGVDHKLMHLVKMRASQINGGAYCLDMHSKDARALGETEQRLYALNGWRETPFFNERERAALACDGIADAGFANACSRQRLRRGAETIQRERSGGLDVSGDVHQFVEPPGDFAARGAGKLQAGRGCCQIVVFGANGPS
jgi:AhpD family alkylhydroperoxidase